MIRRANHLVLALFLLAPAALAGDARVGETRVTFQARGTTIRSEPKALGTPLGTLPAGTRVNVLEVRPPWLRVSTPALTGWVQAAETTDLAAKPTVRRPLAAPGTGSEIASRDASAAGRQFDEATERGYKGQHPNLVAAYAQVDEMESATDAMDPQSSFAFIRDAGLGRRGLDMLRPPMIGTQPQAQAEAQKQPEPKGKGIGGLLGGLVEKATGDKRLGGAVGALAGGLQEFNDQVRTAFTPQHEYYLGRAVAANAIATYGLDPDAGRRAYVRQVGDAMVRVSSRIPANWGGYHFEVLNCDEVNGISGPGGFVLVTRGAVMSCRNEEELAGILAHELAHVTQKHGEAVIRQGKAFPTMMSTFAKTAGAAAGADQRQLELVKFFDGVVGESVRTSQEHAYGKQYEFAADLEGTYILTDVNYDHFALRDYLQALQASGHSHGGGATHAAPGERAQYVAGQIAAYGPYQRTEQKAIRTARFASSANVGAGVPPK